MISQSIIPEQTTLILDYDEKNLYIHELSGMIRGNKDITCVLFKGTVNLFDINLSASMIKNYENNILTAWEGDELKEEIELKNFNYIKLKDKLYSVEISNEKGNPMYSLIEIRL